MRNRMYDVSLRRSMSFKWIGDVAQYVKSILGPLPQLKIFPTAGVDIDNMHQVLDAGAAGIGFVRSLFTPADIAARNFDAIQQRARLITARLHDTSRDH